MQYKTKLLSILALLLAAVQGARAANGIYCTASDKGRVVCTDGSIYDNVAAATAANRTAVAKVIWVDESTMKGMALALTDEGVLNPSDAINACNYKNTSLPVAGATWKLASQDEWNTMVNAAGGHAALRDGFSSVGGTNMEQASYYSSTGDNSALQALSFDSDDNLGEWSWGYSSWGLKVRACLVFDLLPPYTIGSDSEWDAFCTAVNGGNNLGNCCVKLTANISVSTMAGTDETNSFQGTFDGGGHTLTVNYNTSEDYAAPFRHTKNATIKNLTVTGTITTSAQFAGGIVAGAHDALNIMGCRSSVAISSSKSGEGSHGGLVGTTTGTGNSMTISNSIYDGSFATSGGTTGCGGFVGSPTSNNLTITGSLLKPSSVAADMLSNTFARWQAGNEPTISNSYFVSPGNLPTDQGMQAYAAAPDGEISKKVTAVDGNTYYMLCTVSGVETSYDLSSNIVRITPVVTAPYSGTTLISGTNYTTTLDAASVTEFPIYISQSGSYTLALTGKGDYAGTKTFNIAVTGTTPYTAITSASTTLSDGQYIVADNVTISSRIQISGDVTLFLGEGYTLTAQKGIEVSTGSLTIDGRGTLTATGAMSGQNRYAGIGVSDGATLTINGGVVNATGESYASGIGTNSGGTSFGTITINGGVVNATGGYLSAGIGGNNNGNNTTTELSGDIIINGGQVTANGQNYSAGIGPARYNKHTGTLKIGWTKLTDFVNCNSYTSLGGESGTITFADGKTFVLEGTMTFADVSNMGGNKIVPVETPALSGDGSESTPYLITNAGEWTTFAANVALGRNNYSDKQVRLDADISVSAMVGTSETNSFQGTFLGNGHTLTFTQGTSTSAFGEDYCAPFRYVSGATISGLKVAGDIYTSKKYAAGLVSRTFSTTTITDCQVGTTVYSSASGEGIHGGIVALPSGTLSIANCAFTGRLLTSNSTTNCGGIVASLNDATISVTTSLYAPSGSIPEGWSAITGGATIVCDGTPTITDCYYTEAMGTAQGTQVLTTLPDEVIAKRYTASGITVYAAAACTVSGVSTSYNLDDGIPQITPVVTDAGTSNNLTFGAGFMASLDGNSVVSLPITISAAGNHTLVITGVGNYIGSKTFSISATGEVPSVTLTDADTYTIDEDRGAASATYTKTVDESHKGKYMSWLVPFDYTITAADLEKFDFWKIDMIAHSPDPAEEASDKIWVIIKKMSLGDMLHANMPYFYMAKEAVTDYAFTTTGAVLKAKNTGVIAKTETMEEIYNFYAAYEPTAATSSDPFYYVNGLGTISYGTSVTLPALRWFIRVQEKYGDSTPQAAYARQMIIFDRESETTGITTTDATDSTDSAAWYTLDGRKLNGKPAKSGIYVVNGRKVVIK